MLVNIRRRVRLPVWLMLVPVVVWWIDFPGWLLTLFTITYLLFIYTTYKQSIFDNLGIPGPKPTPFLGDLKRLSKEGFFHMDIDLVQQHGQFFGTYIGNLPTLMVSDPEMIKEIGIKQFAKFTDHTQGLGVPKFWKLALNNSTGGYWKYLRSVISPTFSAAKMREMQPVILSCLQSFITVLEKKTSSSSSEFNIQPMFGALTMDIICRTAFGIEVDSQTNPDDKFVANAAKCLDFNIGQVPILIMNILFPETRHLINKMHRGQFNRDATDFLLQATKAAIAVRRQESANFNDLLQLMIKSHKVTDEVDTEESSFSEYKTRGLTDDEIQANAVMFLLAGYDTTAATLTWLTFCVASHPECQDRLFDEIHRVVGQKQPTYSDIQNMVYLDMVLSETLRLYSPASRTNRQVYEDIEVCGRKLPKGTSVTFPISGIHRLEEFWPEPDKFDPERFSPENKDKINSSAYMPFGIGPRKCVGMRLALMEVKMTIVVLLQKYRIELAKSQQVPPKIGNQMIVKPEGGLLVQLQEREQETMI